MMKAFGSLAASGIIAFLAIILLAPGVQAAGPEAQTVTADGVAEVLSGKTDMARDVAIADALRRAVAQVTGTIVESSTLVQNFQLVTDKIYTQTKGYVRNYQIVSERQDNTLYKVTVKATVDTENLATDLQALGLLYQRMNKPRMMVIVTERHGGATATDSAGETEIVRLLIKKDEANVYFTVDVSPDNKINATIEGDDLLWTKEVPKSAQRTSYTNWLRQRGHLATLDLLDQFKTEMEKLPDNSP